MSTGGARKLEYLLATKGQFLCVTLLGALTEENLPILDQCVDEIEKLSITHCVFQFRDVIELNRSIIHPLIRIQQRVRAKVGVIRICALSPAFRKWLDDESAIRPEELTPNLLEAWQEFSLKKTVIRRTGQRGKSS